VRFGKQPNVAKFWLCDFVKCNVSGRYDVMASTPYNYGILVDCPPMPVARPSGYDATSLLVDDDPCQTRVLILYK
jgi:hypothetical protein